MEFIPHPYQKKVIDHIVEHPRTGVFLGMGLGKTAICLSAILCEMYDKMDIDKVLIIAPKKVAEATWQDEAKKWDYLRNLTFSTVLGTEEQREEALRKTADIYIINRENTVWLMEHFRYCPPFDMLVIDESTSFKNPASKRFRALKKVRGCFKKIVLLTGTPRPNSAIDLWSQLYLLDGGERLGKTLTSFRDTYFVPDRRNGAIVYSYRLKNAAAEKQIYRRIGDICISLKSEDYRIMPDVLPPVYTPVELSPKDMKAYKELEREQVLELADSGEDITAMSAGALMTKLHQMANGAIYTPSGDTFLIHNSKIQALREIAESGENLLVFYSFKSDLARLKESFPEAQELKGVKELNDWNKGLIPMLLAHPSSAGYGLNLQKGGHIVIWFGLTWSLEQYQQANARLARQGQTEPVVINHLVAKGTVDEQIIRALKRKEKGQAAMMEAVKMLIESYRKER